MPSPEDSSDSRPVGDSFNSALAAREQAFTLYQLEYKASAERYENIYKASWQDFSYLGAMAAGILAFASRSLPLSVALTIACLPLLFWFLATYLPMDHY